LLVQDLAQECVVHLLKIQRLLALITHLVQVVTEGLVLRVELHRGTEDPDPCKASKVIL
jgi:hypothetical protein